MDGMSRHSVEDVSVSYYQQPGGCVEISQDGEDVVHFCTYSDARAVLAEFGEFIDDAERRQEQAECPHAQGARAEANTGRLFCRVCGVQL